LKVTGAVSTPSGGVLEGKKLKVTGAAITLSGGLL